MFLSLLTLQGFPSALLAHSPRPMKTPTHPTHPSPRLLDTQLATDTACCSPLRTPFLLGLLGWGTATTKQCWCQAAFTFHPPQMTPTLTISSMHPLSLHSHRSRHFCPRACHHSQQCCRSGLSMDHLVQRFLPWPKPLATLGSLLQSKERTTLQANSSTFLYQVRHHMFFVTIRVWYVCIWGVVCLCVECALRIYLLVDGNVVNGAWFPDIVIP